MQIYVSRAGQQTGPFSQAEMQTMLSTGEISLTDLAWQEGVSSWIPLHQLLNAPPPLPTTDAAGKPRITDPTSFYLYIPTGRLVVMSIISLGIYEAYWIYRNWRYLKQREGLNIMPFWRGIFGIFHIHSLLKKIKYDAQTNRIVAATFSPGILATFWVVLILMGNALGKSSDVAVNLIGLFISIFSVLCLVPVQRYINSANEKLPVRPPYYGWSAGHFVCLGIGIIMWFLILMGVILPEPPEY